MSTTDGHLREALDSWHLGMMKELAGGNDDFFSPEFIMTNILMEHIVDLAHFDRLSTTNDLAAQTNW